MVQLWDTKDGQLLCQLEGHEGRVSSLAFSPNGRWLASGSYDRTVRLWDAEDGQLLRRLEGHEEWVTSLAFSPDGRWLASGSWDRTVRLWDAEDGQLLCQLEGHEGRVTSLAFSPDGRWLASGSWDRTVRLWDAEDGQLLCRLEGHEEWVTSLAFSPDGRWLASGSWDRTVRLWDAVGGHLLRRLEGHEGGVDSLAFSPVGRWLASGSGDRMVRLWDAASGDLFEVHRPHPAKFASHGSLFVTGAVIGEPFDRNRIWLRPLGSETVVLDADVLAGKPAPLTTRITSAKVVLLGDSDMGKTALALRLAEDRYEEQTTTHGMRVWTLAAEQLDTSIRVPGGERREVVLWDLGGQEEYRLIHQLFIHDTELALILFDATRGGWTFDGVREWNARLACQRKSQATSKLLIGSKLDYGSASVDMAAVEALKRDCQAELFLPTSARTLFGIDALREALASRINWTKLAETSRPALFQCVADEIDRVRKQGEVTLAFADLRETIQRNQPEMFDAKAVDQVVDQLARQGIVADTRLSSGERVLILQLGEIERYAGSLIYMAKTNLTTRGVPVLDEREIVQSDIEFPRIPRHERLLPSRERVVLECVVQLLIERGICLRQPGLLIFPSLFPFGEDDHVHGADSVSLYYDFTGPIDNLYAALIAQAAQAEQFGRVRLSPGRAEFEHSVNGLCGLRRKQQRSGRGHLDIFFSSQTSLETRQLFRRFVEDFLKRNGVNVTEAMEIRCRECSHLFAEDDVRKVIEADNKAISCPLGHPTEIGEAVSSGRQSSPAIEQALVALKTDIDDRLQRSAANAKRAIGRLRMFVSYAHNDDDLRAELAKHLSSLKHEGVLEVWDDRYIGPGDEWESAIDIRLDEAEIVLLLLSADFMNSAYCRKETERALKRRKIGETVVIPVILKPVDWTSSALGGLQALPQDGKPIVSWTSRDEGWLNVVKGVRRTLDSLLRKPTPKELEVAENEAVITTPSRSIRILHLSDLHFDANTDPIQVFQPLAQDIQDPDGELGFSELDYLVISGDLTQRGLPIEFERVQGFLDRLMERFGLSPERTLIVPGNHDLCWDTEVYDWMPGRKIDTATLKSGCWREEGSGYLLRNDSNYGKRFENFAKFYSQRMHQSYPLEAEQQGISLLAERDRIQLLGLNSAWEIDEYFQDRSSIHPGAVARALELSDKQVKDALKAERLSTEADLLRIAVWHHPATGNDKITDDAFLDQLRLAGVKLCLHGHVHEDKADIVRYTDPRKLYVAGAGSFGAVAKERPESTPRLYNLLELVPDRSSIRVHTRCMAKANGPWTGWAVWPGEKKGERRTYYDIPLTRS